MGVLRESGRTKLSLAAMAAGSQPRDELLDAVREAAQGEFTVIGELGRAPDGAIAYLARDLASARLVALRLTHAPQANEYLLEVARELNATVPAPPTTCPRCSASVGSWQKFCTQCGTNLWSDRAAGARRQKPELLRAVQDATQGKFEILGEMSAAGGGVVYFARDLETGKLEALRLHQEGEQEFSIGLTGVLHRLAAPIANYRPPPPGR